MPLRAARLLEVYASAKGIARRYARLSGHDIGAKAIEERLDDDLIARDVWTTAVAALAMSLAHLVLAVDPERIIIGGGLSHAGDTLLLPIRIISMSFYDGAKFLPW